LPQFGFSQL